MERPNKIVASQGNYSRNEIKKMFEHCGVAVTALHRTCIGNLHLSEDMAFGACRELTNAEIALLQGK